MHRVSALRSSVHKNSHQLKSKHLGTSNNAHIESRYDTLDLAYSQGKLWNMDLQTIWVRSFATMWKWEYTSLDSRYVAPLQEKANVRLRRTVQINALALFLFSAFRYLIPRDTLKMVHKDAMLTLRLENMSLPYVSYPIYINYFWTIPWLLLQPPL